MANLKYNEETKIISFRIPVSKIPIVREKVNSILLDIKEKVVIEFKVDDKKIEAIAKKTYKKLCKNSGVDSKEKFKVVTFDVKKECDCRLDENGLLRRGKILCKKSKAEHKF